MSLTEEQIRTINNANPTNQSLQLGNVLDEASGVRLERVDRKTREAVQIGIEYISPQQHGGHHGVIYRRYFHTALPTDLTAGNNISKLIDYELYAHNGSERHVIHGFYNNSISIHLAGTSGKNNLVLTVSGQWMGNLLDGWADYRK